MHICDILHAFYGTVTILMRGLSVLSHLTESPCNAIMRLGTPKGSTSVSRVKVERGWSSTSSGLSLLEEGSHHLKVSSPIVNRLLSKVSQ